MRKLYLLVTVLLYNVTANSQNIEFVDPIFKGLLLSIIEDDIIFGQHYVSAYNQSGTSIIIDSNHDGQISISEALEVYDLYVEPPSQITISSIGGIEFFTNLKTLSLTRVNTTILQISTLSNLETLLIGQGAVDTLSISNLTSLHLLICDSSGISNLNLMNLPLLSDLRCSNNLLASIDVSAFPQLISLDCSNNLITNLNLSGRPLYKLSCAFNPIQNILFGLPLDLKVLDVSNTGIPPFDLTSFVNLTHLTCNDNQWSELNLAGLNNLKVLDCSNNQLNILNFPGTDLEYLYCSNNQITTLSLSQPKLETLHCSNNLLTTIDFSETPKLARLTCNANFLTTLDLNATQIHYLNCTDNFNLAQLQIKNGRNQTGLEIGFCPQLNFICIDETEVDVVQNSVNASELLYCEINSYCSFTPGGDTFAINGTQRVDFDNNGCDTMDISMSPFSLNISGANINGRIVTNSSGSYTLSLPQGTFAVTPQLENSEYFEISPTFITVNFPFQNSPVLQDFCIIPIGLQADLEIVLIPVNPARPGFSSQYKLIYRNKGNQLMSGAITFHFDDSLMDIAATNPSFDGQDSSELLWNFVNLLPFESRIIYLNFSLNSPVDTPPLVGGEILIFSVSADSQISDVTPADNIFSLQQQVVNSFDPNDKTCLEGSAITPEMAGEYVHYMIRFENTGTYFAENIVVKDMIDTSKFDISSLIPLDGSHPFITRITEVNKVEFIFENIMLPFDDENNDGYVAFKIRTKPTLVTGDTFSNSAAIYFDYNHPIITNTATTTFAVLGVDEQNFRNHFTLYPNPATEFLSLNPKENIEVSSVSVFNLNGQLNMTLTNPDLQKIDVSHLASGQYVIQLNTAHGMYSIKFLKK